MEIKGYFVSDIPRRTFLGRSVKGGIAIAAAPTLVSLLESCAGGDLSTASAKVEVDEQIINATINRALRDGGEFADVYVEKRISRNILMEESKFKSAEFGVSQGAGVRVISGDKTGYAYTEEITEEKKQLIGCDDVSCMAEIAGALGILTPTATSGPIEGDILTPRLTRVTPVEELGATLQGYLAP